jgi:dolichol-phosphate mannosyltransferase
LRRYYSETSPEKQFSPYLLYGNHVDLALVIPVCNEAGNIAPLLDEIATTLAGWHDYEIIVVDDGSTDATALQLAEARQRYPALRVIRHRHRSGQSAALVTGIRAARAYWVLTLDGDGQNDPADIPRLYEAMDRAPDDLWLVAGVRRRRADNWLKRLSSRLANRLRRAVLRDQAVDSACGLRLLARESFLALPQFDHMHRFLPALIRRQGGRVQFVEVTGRARRHGRSHYGIRNRLWAGLVDLLGVAWLQRRALQPDIESED